MLAHTTSWFCDTCDHLIEKAEHGWVEWIGLSTEEDAPLRGRDIRIVHHSAYSEHPGGCQFKLDAKDPGSIGDFALTEFQGPDGLMRLLEMIAENDLPTPELLEIIKRIHIPGYERARRHFKSALSAEVITLNVAYGYWWQAELQLVLEFARQRKRM